MKSILIFLSIAALVVLQSCVQKSYDRTIRFRLHSNGIKDVSSAGVRGNDKPLNWEVDFPLRFDPTDSTYVGEVTMNTGYLFTEFKFTLNGEFELREKQNRKLIFKDQDTVIYNAYFNAENQLENK